MTDINVGAISEALNNKADRDLVNSTPPYLKTTYVNGTSGYSIWSNGWCIQWGAYTGTTNDQNVVNGVALLKTMANTNYFACLTSNSTNTTINTAQPDWIYGRTTTHFSVHIDSYTDGASKDWLVIGYLAQGQY